MLFGVPPLCARNGVQRVVPVNPEVPADPDQNTAFVQL